jgi:hypothetical protein
MKRKKVLKIIWAIFCVFIILSMVAWTFAI